MEESFGRDISGDWHYLSIVFCLDLHPDIKSHCQSCPTCNDFIIHGENEIARKLDKMESRLPKRPKISKHDQEDFKALIKYMLFSMPKKSLPIGGNFTKAVRKAINEASDLENIKICAFPTKEQRLVLNSEKAIIAAPWGCGKTWMMSDKAIEFAMKGEAVVFGIFKDIDVKGEPLILFDLELKFKEFPNIEIKLIPFDITKKNNLKDYTNETKIFFGDEFTDRFYHDTAKNETISFLNSLDFCWLTVSNSTGNKGFQKRNLRDYIASWKPEDYNVIEMNTPIRSTREIAKHLKENLNEQYKYE